MNIEFSSIRDKLKVLTQRPCHGDGHNELLSLLDEFFNCSGLASSGLSPVVGDCFIFIQRLLNSECCQAQILDWLNTISCSCNQEMKSLLGVQLFSPILEPPFVFDESQKCWTQYGLLRFLEHDETAWVVVSSFADYFDSSQLEVEIFAAVAAANEFAESRNFPRIAVNKRAVLREIKVWTV